LPKLLASYYAAKKSLFGGGACQLSKSYGFPHLSILLSKPPALEDDKRRSIAVCLYDLEGCGEREAKGDTRVEYEGMPVSIADLSEVSPARAD